MRVCLVGLLAVAISALMSPAIGQEPSGSDLTPGRQCGTKQLHTDGVHCVIESSRTITKPKPACGLDKTGRTKPGLFLTEHLRYEHWRAGKLIASWYDNSETFQDCVE